MTDEERKARKREYDRKRYLEKREETKARAREYYERNREARLVQVKDWAEKNRTRVDRYKREYKRRNPDRARADHVRATYNIPPSVEAKWSEEQGHRCLICGRHKSNTVHGRLVIDHCHDTGQVRGLLCSRCNTGIGLLMDSPEIMFAAIAYLEATGTAKDFDPDAAEVVEDDDGDDRQLSLLEAAS